MGGLPEVVYAVDDDESFLKALLRLLKSAGLKAHGFKSLEDLRSDMPLPQGVCLVIDIILGSDVGLDIPKKLFESGTEPPLIFVSATDDENLLARANEISKQPCLRKPFEYDRLLEALRDAMALHLEAENRPGHTSIHFSANINQ